MNSLLKTAIGIGIGAIALIAVSNLIIKKVFDRRIDATEEEYTQKLLAIQSQKDSLKRHSDSIDFVLAQYMLKNDSLNNLDKLHRVEIDNLKEELKDVLNAMFDEMTEDAHYSALQNMFPTVDSLEYGFSGEQVKSIHMELVASLYKDSIITKQEMTAEILRSQVLNYAEMADVLINEKEDLNALIGDLQDQLLREIEEGRMSKKEVNRLKKIINRYRAGALGVAGAAILLLIFL